MPYFQHRSGAGQHAFLCLPSRTRTRLRLRTLRTLRGVALSLVCFAAAGRGDAAESGTGNSGSASRLLSTEEFIRLVGPEEAARLFREASGRAVEAPSEVTRDGPTLRFRGPIHEASAAAFENALNQGPADRLYVTSDGGYVDAGLRIGRLVRDHGLAVIVEGYCVSSCANYIFTAGRTRTIAPNAVVVWHGNAAQKDQREFDQCGRTVSSFEGLPLLAEEIDEMRASKPQRIARRQAEIEFFASIGTDDYIARAGQEPRFYGNFTMTVEDMAKFGVRNVTAPPDYGTRDFCRAVNQQRGTDLHCIAVTDQDIAYERARRALGEACQPDGTLRIRTSTALNAHAATVPSRSDR